MVNQKSQIKKVTLNEVLLHHPAKFCSLPYTLFNLTSQYRANTLLKIEERKDCLTHNVNN